MKVFVTLLVVLCFSFLAEAQTTYTWNAASGVYSTATNWTPNRVTVAKTDILVFDGSVVATPFVVGFATDSVAQLIVKNNANVNLRAAAAATLNLQGGTGIDFDIQAGSTLKVDSSLAITINLGTGATGVIAGTFIATNSVNLTPNPAHKLLADSLAIVVVSGGQVEQGSAAGTNWFSGNLFGNSGKGNVITFEDGSTYIQRAGSNPFGLTQPATKVTFKPNSNYKFYLSGSPALTGRTFGNFIVGNGANCNPGVNLSADCIMYNVIQETGAACAWITTGTTPAAGTLRIRGNVTVNGTFAFSLANFGVGGVVFDGATPQTITNLSTKTVTFIHGFNVAATANLKLNNSVITTGPVNVSGILDVDTCLISGTGNFSVLANATYSSKHPNGINNSLTTTGTTAYSSDAYYGFGGARTGNFNPTPDTTSIKGMIINSATDVTLDRDFLVSSSLKLQSGKVNVNNKYLGLGLSMVIEGGSKLSYINGTLYQAVGAPSIKNFPIGNDSIFRPVTLQVNSVTGSDFISGKLNNVNPNPTSIPASVTKISSDRFYRLAAGSGITSISCDVTLPFGSDDKVTDLAHITVARGMAGAAFSTESNAGGTTGVDTMGTVKGTFSGLGDFALANKIGGTNPLPVELVSFSATKSGTTVVLNWATATETNNKGFEIERKSDNGLFAKVGFVAGNINSTKKQSYSFTDNSNVKGNVVYRLKQIDLNGEFNYSNEISTSSETPDAYELSQNYPNPFNPSTVISYTLPVDSKVTLSVYNTKGEEVAKVVNGVQTAGKYTVSFNTANYNLASGVYFYRLNAGSYTSIKKMVVLK